jgi:hypothetical protein
MYAKGSAEVEWFKNELGNIRRKLVEVAHEYTVS